jgi:opacity protein-like surface antigen
VLTLGLVQPLRAAEPPVVQPRTRTIQIFAAGQFWPGITVDAEESTNPDLEIDYVVGGGVGVAYDITPAIQVSSVFMAGTAPMRREFPGATLETDADVFAVDVLVDYNFLPGRLTPLVTAGIGSLTWSGDWKDASGGFRESHWSAGAGTGVRWDPTDHLAMKLVYRAVWTDFKSAEVSLFHTIALMIGYCF